MDETLRLGLPSIMPSQAQKHVTHNEALRMLDALVHLSVASRVLSAPPEVPAAGIRHIVGPAPTGAWAGQQGRIAAFDDGAWTFFVPQSGWRCWVADEALLLVYANAVWRPAGDGSAAHFSQVGVNTGADATNRLAAKTDAVLLTHDDVTPGTGSMRVVLNKNAVAATGSLLFQTGFSGRAEMGLCGTDAWQVKVSPNGNAWTSALVVDAATAKVSLPAGAEIGPAVCSSSLQVNGMFGIGRSGANAGGMYFNRASDVPFIVFSAGDAASPTNIAQIRASLAGTYVGIGGPGGTPFYLACRTDTQRVGIMTTSPSNTLSVAGIAAPESDNAFSCGTSAKRWSTIYAATGTIATSDARDKIVTGPMGSAAARIVDAVAPVMFRWAVGGTEVVETGTERVPDGEDADGMPQFIEVPVTEERSRPGRRRHLGWLAQDVKAALDGEDLDCGAWGLDDPADADSRQWVRPDQMTALLWEALRQTRSEIAALRAELSSG